MILENGGYLWLLIVIPCFLVYSLVSRRNADRLLYRFARVRKSFVPHVVSTICLGLALGSVVFSLAEPSVQYTRVVFNRSGIDLVIGIDVSKSMLAEDETIPEDGRKLFAVPNRLNRARYSALSIISSLRGERAGVFVFASRGVPIVPLTTDYGYCRYVLKHVNDATITIPGSDLGQAIDTGVSMLEGGNRKAVRAVILISDGEDISDDKSSIYEAAQRAASRGIAVYTVGTGMGQGVLIPIRDSSGGIDGYYMDETGSYLKTRLEQDILRSISEISGGSYFRARDEQSEERLIESVLKRARTVEYTKAFEPAWYQLSPLLLCAAFLFLIAGIIAGR